MNRLVYILAALTLLSLPACASFKQHKSIYQALGQQPGIEKLVDAFIVNIGNDKQVFHYFADANLSRFREEFIVHLCTVSDGPCRYTGDSMEDIHTGMKISEADFNRVVELLVDAMSDCDVSFTTQNKLLAKMAPMRDNIIKR